MLVTLVAYMTLTPTAFHSRSLVIDTIVLSPGEVRWVINNWVMADRDLGSVSTAEQRLAACVPPEGKETRFGVDALYSSSVVPDALIAQVSVRHIPQPGDFIVPDNAVCVDYAFPVQRNYQALDKSGLFVCADFGDNPRKYIKVVPTGDARSQACSYTQAAVAALLLDAKRNIGNAAIVGNDSDLLIISELLSVFYKKGNEQTRSELLGENHYLWYTRYFPRASEDTMHDATANTFPKVILRSDGRAEVVLLVLQEWVIGPLQELNQYTVSFRNGAIVMIKSKTIKSCRGMPQECAKTWYDELRVLR